MEPMTDPADKNVKERLAELRRTGDPRVSAESKALAEEIFTNSEWGEQVDQLMADDFVAVDSNE